MLYKINKNGEFNNYDLFKIIALVVMIIDHIGFYLFPYNLWFRAIGRISFPIFAVLHGITFKQNKSTNSHILLIYGLLVSGMFFGFFRLPIFDAMPIKPPIFPVNILISFYCFNFIFNRVYKLYQDTIVCTILLIGFMYPLYIIFNYGFEYGIFTLLFMIVGKNFCKVGTNIIDIIFNISVFIGYILIAHFCTFHFSIYQLILAVVLLSIVYINLCDFNFREYYHIKSNAFLLFLSRYSLELYVVQTFIFLCFLFIKITTYIPK